MLRKLLYSGSNKKSIALYSPPENTPTKKELFPDISPEPIFGILWYYINWPGFITKLGLLSKLFSKICSVFHVYAFDDAMTFKYLKN